MTTNKQFDHPAQQTLTEIMLHRRDIRGNNFTHEPVANDILEKIIHAATMAPSVGFSQPWEFVIIKDQATKKQIADNFSIENEKAKPLFDDEKRAIYNQLKLEGIIEAPINIAVFYRPSSTPVLGQTSVTEVGEYSVVCAVQNMWLMARAHNIGVGWVSILNPEVVKKCLNAPPENKLIAYLCVGHVKAFENQPELEKLNWAKRKQITMSVHQNTY